MPKLIVNLFVAILTFVIGSLASALFNGASPSTKTAKEQTVETRTRTVLIARSEPLAEGCASHQDSLTNDDAGSTTTAAERAPISGGVLNGRALNLPQPPYPPIAKAAHATGTVMVEVIVNERGCVVWSRAVSGHPLLQQAAVQAAYQACFAPTLLGGEPVKIRGVLTYNFVIQ